jgi:bifunctional ADP-heptose synthase (sugar kinase/adenylyltransferase)|tara:strand:+ start:3206 stop:3961 length:756 start_codon:yes stop_codon:yes gene_type:complete
MKVLVIGDVCEDVYVYGKCNRLAPEAPVPVFVKTREKRNGGMALNVFNNLKALGVDCDIVHNAEEIEKTRYVDTQTNHIFIRIDSDEAGIKRVDKKVLTKKYLSQYDAIVISDYNKGFLSETDIEKICYYHPLTFMDTKKKLGRWSEDCKWIKINEPEYNNTKKEIQERMYVYEDSLIVTLGSKGCKYKNKTYTVNEVEIKDLVGAGDTFLAGFVSRYLHTKNVDDALIFANECATIVVQQKGVNVVQKSE